MIKKIICGLSFVFLVQFLVACSGDDECEFYDNCTSGGSGSVTPAISLKLLSADTGLEVSSASLTGPVRLVATVTGTPDNTVVSFSTDKGTLSADAALVSAGKAEVNLYSSGANGVGQAKASITVKEVTIETTLAFQIPSIASGITLNLISSFSGATISASTPADPGRLQATVAGTTQPVTVKFETTKGAVSSSLVFTDAGIATVAYIPAELNVVNKVTASVVDAADLVIHQTSIQFDVRQASGVDERYIQFVSASPETLTLKGAGGGGGGSEISQVTFKVVDDNNNPVSGQTVNFLLDTTTGGIGLASSSTISDSNGLAVAKVSSGTVATSVIVTAQIKDVGDVVLAFIQSSRLVISSGMPDQDSFSLSASVFNTEGWNYDGVVSTITVRLGDRNNNSIPDGTAVSFYAEGGIIDGSCVTIASSCEVNWTSQEPRPLNGRVTITATAIGEESFPDINGNGRFDASEMAAFAGNDVSGRPFDLAEAFTDYNEDGVFGGFGGELERLMDFNGNGLWDNKDGQYNGSYCSIPAHAGCSTNKTVNLRGELVIVMVGSDPVIDLNVFGSVAEVCLSDENGQQLPQGTTVAFSYTGSLSGNPAKTYIWPNSNAPGPRCYYPSIVASSSDPGTMDVVVITPKGTRSEFTYSYPP